MAVNDVSVISSRKQRIKTILSSVNETPNSSSSKMNNTKNTAVLAEFFKNEISLDSE